MTEYDTNQWLRIRMVRIKVLEINFFLIVYPFNLFQGPHEDVLDSGMMLKSE